jgi:hypothetical protein
MKPRSRSSGPAASWNGPGASTHAELPPARPAAGAELIGFADDIVSGQQYRLWRLPPGAVSRGRLGLRSKRQPAFFVEDVASGVGLVQLYSWAESVAWHDRRVISCGWQAVSDQATQVDWRSGGAAGDDAEPGGANAAFRLLPVSREFRTG